MDDGVKADNGVATDHRWTVGELAKLANVTVRTLHHYEEIGLLIPSERTDAGYRLYGPAEVDRLHSIRVHRALGLPLERIRALLDDPATSRATALRQQLDELRSHHVQMARLIRTVERTLRSIQKGESISGSKMFEGFEELGHAPDDIREHHRTHAKEAHERWGETEAWRESSRRTGDYTTKQQWTRLGAEGEAIEARMAELLLQGESPTGARALAAADAMRLHIDRWFYPCSKVMHVGLAEMYEADPRFRAHYEDRQSGLSAFVATAIRANGAEDNGSAG